MPSLTAKAISYFQRFFMRPYISEKKINGTFTGLREQLQEPYFSAIQKRFFVQRGHAPTWQFLPENGDESSHFGVRWKIKQAHIRFSSECLFKPILEHLCVIPNWCQLTQWELVDFFESTMSTTFFLAKKPAVSWKKHEIQKTKPSPIAVCYGVTWVKQE